MTDEQIKHMVDRFLMWKLPETFNPDGGIKFQRLTYGGNVRHDPVGTNVLTAIEADAMVRHMIEGMPDSNGDGK